MRACTHHQNREACGACKHAPYQTARYPVRAGPKSSPTTLLTTHQAEHTDDNSANEKDPSNKVVGLIAPNNIFETRRWLTVLGGLLPLQRLMFLERKAATGRDYTKNEKDERNKQPPRTEVRPAIPRSQRDDDADTAGVDAK